MGVSNWLGRIREQVKRVENAALRLGSRPQSRVRQGMLEALESRALLSTTLDWHVPLDAAAYANTVNQSINQVVVDSTGAVYAVGSFNGTVDFDPSAGTSSVTSASDGGDLFLAKYSSAGALVRVLTWSPTGSGSTAFGSALVVDGSDNVYLAGNFTGTMDRDPGAGTQSSTGSNTNFVIKVNDAGVYQWSFVLEGANDHSAKFSEMQVVGSSLWIAGYMPAAALDLDPSGATADFVHGGQEASFVASYSTAAGAYSAHWAFLPATGMDNGIAINGFDIDPTNNNFVITGTLKGTADVDPSAGASNLTSTGPIDILVASFNPTSGALSYANHYGVAGATYGASGQAIAVDAFGNAYVTGTWGGEGLDFVPGAGNGGDVPGDSQFSKPFVLSLETDGDYRWSAGLAVDDGEGRTVSVFSGAAADSSRVFFGGYFSSAADFDPGAAEFIRAAGPGNSPSEGFIWIFDGNGNFQDAPIVTGAEYQDVRDVAAVTVGTYYAAFANGGSGGIASPFVPGVAQVLPGAATPTQTSVGQEAAILARYNDTAGATDGNATVPPQIDLGFGANTVPDSILETTTARGNVIVTVTNDGNDPLPRTLRGTINVYARPVGGGVDVLIGSRTNQAAGNLASNATKNYSIPVNIPGSLAAGAFIFVAEFIGGNDTGEWSAVDAAGFTVAPAFNELGVNLTGASIPASVVTGDGTKIKVPVNVVNNGNVALPAGTTIDVIVALRPAGAGDDSQDLVLLTLNNQSIAGLKVGATKKLTANVLIPAGTASNDYVIVAKIDTSNDVTETNEGNNSAATTSQIDAELGFVNLLPTFGTVGLPPAVVAGSTVKGSVTVNVENDGNVALARGQTISLLLQAVPVGGGEPQTISTLTNQSVSALKPNAVKKFTFKTVNLTGLNGQYTYRVIADSGAVVTESNEADNTVLNATPLTVAPAFVDLSIPTSGHNLAANLTAGDEGVATLTITNLGNVDANGTVDITVLATKTGAGDVTIGQVLNYSVKLKPGATTRTISVPVTVTGALDGTYTIKVNVAPSTGSAIVDNNAANDIRATGADITVAPISANSILGAGWAGTFDFTRVGTATGPSHDGLLNSLVNVGGAKQITENGTFVDEFGRTGKYALVWGSIGGAAGTGFLNLTYDDGQGVPFPGFIQKSIEFRDNNIHSFHNKSVEFIADISSELGTLRQIGGAFLTEFRYV